jgi:hypothetical protein
MVVMVDGKLCVVVAPVSALVFGFENNTLFPEG